LGDRVHAPSDVLVRRPVRIDSQLRGAEPISGTVFFLGYDDHYQQADRIETALLPGRRFERTNRAFFAKFSYLLRY
jgi:hypothetical protein